MSQEMANESDEGKRETADELQCRAQHGMHRLVVPTLEQALEQTNTNKEAPQSTRH